MLFLLILIIMCIFLYGLYGMKMVDENICNNIFFEFNEKNKVLIYGNNDLVDVVENICEEKKIGYDVVNNNIQKQINKEYTLLISLSNDDLENLMVCSLGKKVFSIRDVVSLCNNAENKHIYDDYKVTNIDLNNAYPQNIILIIKEKLEKCLN